VLDGEGFKVRKARDPLILEWASGRVGFRGSARSVEKFCEWTGKPPRELLEMEKAAATNPDERERFQVADLVQGYVRGLKGRRSYKLAEFSKLKSWFRFHRRKLPDDYDREFIQRLRSDRPATFCKLRLEVLRDVLTAVRNDPRKRSMFLVQFQSFSGIKELMLINRHYGHYIGHEVKKGASLIELEMKWPRKGNERPYYSYIGKDAVEELRRHFEGERGWPKPGEPIWFHDREPGTLITSGGYYQMWSRLLASLGYRPPVPRKAQGKGSWERYGVGPHNLRDLAISMSQAAMSEGFNPQSADYFAGHTIDDLGYRQLHDLDPKYRREQYQIVEPFLNLVSGGVAETGNVKEYQVRMEALQRQVDEVMKWIEELKRK